MEGSLHRFRLGRAESPPRVKARRRGAEASACKRCRQMKRRCKRTESGCVICGNARVRCSFEPEYEGAVEDVTKPLAKEKEKEALEMATSLDWLSVCLNDNSGQDEQTVGWTRLSREDAMETDVSSSVAGEESQVRTSIQAATGTLVQKDHPTRDRGVESPNASPGSSRSHQASIPTRILGLGPSRSTTSKTAAGRQLVDAYFRHIHRSYPFINRASVLSDVDSMMHLSEGFEHISRKLYLIMAIGCTTLRRIGQVSDDILAKFKVLDQVIIQDCLSRKDIESVEELLLLALYSFFDPSLSPWIITGILTRHMLTLGLTRKVSSQNAKSLDEVERRHRLFWSIYTLDRIVSASTGLPFGLHDPNTNIPLPGITLEEYASPDRAYFTVTLQVNRHIITLRQLEGSILERTHFISAISLIGSDRRAIVADLRAKIEDWYTQGCLVNPLERDQIPFHNTIPWLNCRYQNLLLLLYMPSSLNGSIISLEHLQILQSAAGKYIQLSAVLFQQRHLPLNWVTLCRFVTLCPTLLYCLVRGSSNSDLAGKAAALSCAEVLEAFNEHWSSAKRAAKVFRRLGDVAATPLLTGVNGLVEEVRELIGDTLGASSIYSGLVDAAVDAMAERGKDILVGGWSTGNLSSSNSVSLSNSGIWMDDVAFWEDGDMSMHII